MNPTGAARLGDQLRAVVATTWRMLPFGFVGGVLLRLMLPVADLRLLLLAVALLGAAGLACLAVGAMGPTPGSLRGLPRAAVLERSSTIEQFGHAFAASALGLAALGLGLWLGGFAASGS